jgi:lipopolysaccharide export system permease protein
MTAIDRYIFRNIFLKFTVCSTVLITIVWITQFIREFDMFTLQGQSFAIVIGITLLSLPALTVIVLPVALLISIIHELNRLNTDSEYPVLCTMGLSPLRILRPFLLMTSLCACLVGGMSLYFMPKSFQDMRTLITQIRASIIGTLVKDGQFSQFIPGVTLYYQKQDPKTLNGIFIEDRRDAKIHLIYTAAQGHLVEENGQSYLILDKGSVQRLTPSKEANAPSFHMIYFDRYSLSLGDFLPANTPSKKPRELTTTELFNTHPDLSPAQRGAQRVELHDRLAAPLYPFIFTFIAFAALGYARPSRGSQIWAIAGAGSAAMGVRLLGFWASQKLLHISKPFLILHLPLLMMGLLAFSYSAWRQKSWLYFWKQPPS